MTSKGQKLSGPILREKAEDLAKKLGQTNFVATEAWLSRWKARHQIGTNGHTSTIPLGLLEEYRPNEIYNADETGMYYRATPDGSLCYCHEKLSGSKKAMERITVICCSNLTGTDKCKLLVIGKSFRPRYFKIINVDNLPVTYHANKKAWMTSQIF